jgi:ribonuclease HI
MTNSRFSSLLIYADGSRTPNGAGAGVIVLDATGNLLHMENKILPDMTNNEAEYAGLMLGLKIAAKLQADVLEVRLDSEVVVNQMRGEFAVRSHTLKACHWQACELARQFPRVRYVCIDRDINTLADALAAEASSGRFWRLGAG